MQSSVETLGTLERKMSVAVPVAQIDQEIQVRLRQMAQTVKLSGFRPGKVPMKVVESRFGGQVRQEVLGDTVEKSFGEAVRAQNLRVAGFPKIEPTEAPADAAEFRYTATFEIYPEVALGDLAAVTITRPELKVTEAEVDKTIDVLRKQRAVYETADRGARKEDQVTIDYRGTIDGTPFQGGEATDQVVMLGAGRLLPEFEAALEGMAAGAGKEFELTFPEDYHGREVAGKKAVFAVTMKRVAEPKLPEIGPDLAKSLGVAEGDVAKMRDEIRANVEREVKARIKARIKDQAMQALLDTARLDVPKALVGMEVERLQQSARQDLEARGIKVKDLPFPADMFQAQAERRVKLGLILAEAVKANGLAAKPEQVRAIVEELAQSYEQPREVVKWYYQSRERMAEVESLVLEDNVVDWVLGRAKTEDKPIEFEELMGNR